MPPASTLTMQTLVPFAIIVLSLLPLLLLAGAVWVWKLVQRRRKRRSPLTTDLLRPPGYGLSERIDDLRLDLDSYAIAALIAPLVFLATYLLQERLGHQVHSATTGIMVGSALILSFAFITQRVIRLLGLIRSHREGRDGEWATAQLLEPVIAGGGRVLHDIQAPGFNIDHVAIAPGGVFAIETKHRLKPTTGDGKADAKVSFDGKALRFPDWTDTSTADQATAQARWLSERLTRATGLPVKARPIIALPGWYVTLTERSEVLAINPKACSFMLKPFPGEPPLAPDTIRRIAYQVEQLCRLPDPNRTGGKQ